MGDGIGSLRLADFDDPVPAPREAVVRVIAAMSGLPIEYRETVVLRFQEGLALEEIATLTKLPLGTVKSRLYRALDMLMGRLKGARP